MSSGPILKSFLCCSLKHLITFVRSFIKFSHFFDSSCEGTKSSIEYVGLSYPRSTTNFLPLPCFKYLRQYWLFPVHRIRLIFIETLSATVRDISRCGSVGCLLMPSRCGISASGRYLQVKSNSCCLTHHLPIGGSSSVDSFSVAI